MRAHARESFEFTGSIFPLTIHVAAAKIDIYILLFVSSYSDCLLFTDRGPTFLIFTQPINAIDVTRVTLSRLNTMMTLITLKVVKITQF